VIAGSKVVPCDVPFQAEDAVFAVGGGAGGVGVGSGAAVMEDREVTGTDKSENLLLLKGVGDDGPGIGLSVLGRWHWDH